MDKGNWPRITLFFVVTVSLALVLAAVVYRLIEVRLTIR